MPIHAVGKLRRQAEPVSSEANAARLGLVGALGAAILTGGIAFFAGAQQSETEYRRERQDTAYVELLNAHDVVYRIEQDIVAGAAEAPPHAVPEVVEALDVATVDYSAASNASVVIESERVAAARSRLDAWHSLFRVIVIGGNIDQMAPLIVNNESEEDLDDAGKCVIRYTEFDEVTFSRQCPNSFPLAAVLSQVAYASAELREAMRSDISE